jgi:hypothetical protein
MLSRINVSSAPRLIIKAPFKLRIHLWTATYVGRHDKSDQAYIAHSKGDCTPATATPLPDPGGGVIPIPIPLEVGEELWVVSESVSLLGMTMERV